LSSLIFSSSLLFSLLFSSLTLPTSAFPSVHIVASLASKLPSAMVIYYPLTALRKHAAAETCLQFR
jgi:hypothetical protein